MPRPHLDLPVLAAILPWGVLTHFFLPWAPEIRLGTKQDGSPRWTSWLESWNVAYDPLVWRLLEIDDREDERVKGELREVGLWMLANGASEDTVAPIEES